MSRIDFALSPQQRADAREALQMLQGTGVSLTEAVRRALQGKRALCRVTVSEAIERFILSRLNNEKRARTVEWYEAKLKILSAAFGKEMIDSVDRPALLAWFTKMTGGAGSRAGMVRACRALWRWCIAHEPQLATLDATAGMKGTSPSSQGEAEFLTVEEVAAILANAGRYQSALAIMLFGAVRPEEMAGRSKPPLLWKHVNVEEKMIRISADTAKTGKPRIIEGLPETVWAWLKPGDDNKPVSPGRTRQALELAQAAIKRPNWPHDATRHTFATYALAFTGDAGKVSTWLGHEGRPTMLHRHYRGLATKADAEKFWALRP